MKKTLSRYIKKALQFLRKFGSHEQLPYYILIFIALVISVLGINFFVALTESVREKELSGFDQQIFDYIISFRTPELSIFFKAITQIGGFFGYLIATGIVAIFFFFKFRNWEFILQLMLVVILAGASNVALKRFIDRPRPEMEHLVVVGSLSYPSGHAMSAMAFYGFLTFLLFYIKMKKRMRTFLSFLFISLIALIGISRIYLGVHYPSDILGGFIAGLIWVGFCIVLFNILILYRKRKARLDPEEEEENLDT